MLFRGHKRTLVLLVLGVIVLTDCLSWIPRTSPASFKAEIESALPEGTPRSEVEAWVEARTSTHGLVAKMNGGRVCGIMGEIPQYWINLIIPSVVRFEIDWDENEKRTTV